LIAFVRFFNKWMIVPFQASAVQVFRELRSAKVRVPTTDLRIAAISLDRGALLLSRNARDFERVPGLNIEDWTRP
jgi:tRNA(fMet)-specific endonuclease VapC